MAESMFHNSKISKHVKTAENPKMPQQKREQRRQRPCIKGKSRKAGGKEGRNRLSGASGAWDYGR